MTHTQPERLRCEVCMMPTLGDNLCNLHYEEQEKMTHTPGPFEIFGEGQITLENGCTHSVSVITTKQNEEIAYVYDAPFAEKIVRACNSYEAMLEALKQAVTYIPQEGDEDLDVYETCIEAIRLAEGRG